MISIFYGVLIHIKELKKNDNKCENIIPNIILNGYSHTYNKKIPKHEKNIQIFIYGYK